MKIFAFGVGQYFQNRKKQFYDISSDDTILGFLDNSAYEGKTMDGFPVFSPSVVSNMQFDRIVLMSTYYQEIISQLLDLGVAKERLFFWEQYRSEKTCGQMIAYNCSLEEPQANDNAVLLISAELGYHGGSVAIVHAAKALMTIGHEVYLASGFSDLSFLHEVVESGIRVIIIPVLPYISETVANWIKQFRAVIVNVFPMIKAACDISQYKPVLWWIHESDGTPDAVYGQTRYQFSEYDNINAMRKIGIYAVSDIARQAFESYYPHQVAGILPYGIPDEAPYTVNNVSHDRFVFAIIGSVCQLKSQLVFLEAAELLSREINDSCEFWVIGSCGTDSYGNKVREKIQSIPHAKICGVMSRHELREAFLKIGCVVCPSMQDSLPIVITEGMMHGKICIVSDQTGMTGYIKDGVSGFVCKAGDVSSLYDCMKKAFDMREKSKALRENARILYEKEFSMDRFAERIDHALQNTIKRYHKDPCPDKNEGWQ